MCRVGKFALCSFDFRSFALLLICSSFFCSKSPIRATMSTSLTSLFKKERSDWFASDLSSNFVTNLVFFICFYSFSSFLCPRANRPNRSLLILFFERLEHFAPVTLYKKVTVSDSLRLLITKEQPRAIRSGRSIQKNDGSDSLFFMNIALSLTKNERITGKTDERISNPDYVWVTPALAPKPSQDNWRSSICLHWNNIYTIHIQYSIIQMQYSIFTVNYSRYMSTP